MAYSTITNNKYVVACRIGERKDESVLFLLYIDVECWEDQLGKSDLMCTLTTWSYRPTLLNRAQLVQCMMQHINAILQCNAILAQTDTVKCNAKLWKQKHWPQNGRVPFLPNHRKSQKTGCPPLSSRRGRQRLGLIHCPLGWPRPWLSFLDSLLTALYIKM